MVFINQLITEGPHIVWYDWDVDVDVNGILLRYMVIFTQDFMKSSPVQLCSPLRITIRRKKMLEKCWVIGGLGWSVWFLYPNYAGWWLSLPLWKIWVRQSGWWHSHKFMESHKNHFPNHQPVYIMDQKLNKTKSSTGYTHDIPMSYLRWRVGGSLFGSTWVKIDDLCSIKTGCKTHFKAVPFW